MSGTISSRVGNMLSSLQRTMQLATEYGTPEQQDLNNFKNVAKAICDAELSFRHAMHALDAAKEENTINDFEKVYNKNLKQSKNKTSKRYNDFLQSAQQSLATASSSTAAQDDIIEYDDVVLNNFISDTDPITKRSLVYPVKNKKCGHHYEKSSILEAIKVNRRLRCPVAGCGNKNFVVKDDLQEDPAFAQLLRNRRSDDSD